MVSAALSEAQRAQEVKRKVLASILKSGGAVGNGGRQTLMEISGEEYQWGQDNFVRLEPARAVAHILNMPAIPADQRMNLLRRE